MPPTTLLLARHADVHNPSALFYGRLPRFRLSSAGKAQAQLLAAFLASEPIAAIYSSPLLRARQTAQVIAARHDAIPVRLRKEFIEINSSLQGESLSTLQQSGFNYYEPQPHDQDESLAQIWTRMRRGIDTLRSRHRNQTFVVVSHGDPIKVVWTAYLGMPLTLASMRDQNYPARASVLRINWQTDSEPPLIQYHNVAGGMEGA